MKKQNRNVPAGSKLNLLRQIYNRIPEFLVAKIARETHVDEMARTFSPWSHVVALGYAQLTHSIGLNDVCDSLQLNSGPLSSIRGATPPSRNNLSNANKRRPAEMAEKLFWAVLKHLGDQSPEFVSGKAGKRFIRQFKRKIHLVDSTTIPLIASCMDWAKHRRRKAAAKCHLRLDLQSFLPRFALVDTAQHADAKRAREVCAGIQAGEIVIFDKAYIDYSHLADLAAREVCWVTRAKDNMKYQVVHSEPQPSGSKVLRDDWIELENPQARQAYPGPMRRIVEGVLETMIGELIPMEVRRPFMNSPADPTPTHTGVVIDEVSAPAEEQDSFKTGAAYWSAYYLGYCVAFPTLWISGASLRKTAAASGLREGAQTAANEARQLKESWTTAKK